MKFEFKIDTERMADEVLREMCYHIEEAIKTKVADKLSAIFAIHPQILGNIPLPVYQSAMINTTLTTQLKAMVQAAIEENIIRSTDMFESYTASRPSTRAGLSQFNPTMSPRWGNSHFSQPQQCSQPQQAGSHIEDYNDWVNNQIPLHRSYLETQMQLNPSFRRQFFARAQSFPDLSLRPDRFQYPFQTQTPPQSNPVTPEQPTDPTDDLKKD